MTVGPVEIFIIAFDDPEFDGEIRAKSISGTISVTCR